jgi:phosphoglycolate phosphatase-like HAD superfamily hydrolase
MPNLSLYMVKAVIFDIDGTLIDSVDLHARAWQEIHVGVEKRLTANPLWPEPYLNHTVRKPVTTCALSHAP